MNPEPPFDIELDLPPEYCHYQDEGCEFSDSCLGCPLPKCIFDEPRGRQHWLKERRDRKIVRLFNQGKGIKELAVMFSISQRTVQRALKNSPSPYQEDWPDDSLAGQDFPEEN